MKGKKKSHRLTVYLAKRGRNSTEDVVKTAECDQTLTVSVGSGISGTLFVRTRDPRAPDWTRLFVPDLDPHDLEVPGVAAAFVLSVDDRTFILTFGTAGRFLIQDDAFEERFGLLCTLNSIQRNTFRCIDVQSLNAIESQSRIQSGYATTAEQFGLNIEEDMLKAVVGTPKNNTMGSRMAGGDQLAVVAPLVLSDLPDLLRSYYRASQASLSASDHQWVNNIAMVKSDAKEAELDGLLDARLAGGNTDNCWLSVPEIIDWSEVDGFQFTHQRGESRPDISLDDYSKTLPAGVALSTHAMRQHKVFCVDAQFQRVKRQWSVLRCLYAQIEHDDIVYIRNDGRWFAVSKDFVKRTHDEYEKIPYSQRRLLPYNGHGEGAYNQLVAAQDPATYDLLDDNKKVMHGGGQGQVEICDLLTTDGELIHVKIYGKSSVLSHLFAQGFVSGQLIQIDEAFREKVQKRLAASHRHLIEGAKKPHHEALTIVFAIISKAKGPKLHLPFFSKVNLNNTRKVLRGFGYKVELLKIDVTDDYRLLSKVRPRGGRRKGKASP